MAAPRFSHETIGFFFAIASAALFAVRPILVKLAYAEGVDSETVMFYRMLFSVPVYIGLLIYFLRDESLRVRLTPSLVAMTAFAGLIGYFGASYFDLLGLQYVTAQLGRMILYTYPTFVILLGILFFSQTITLRTIVSLLVTYIGIAVIFGHDLNQFGPDVSKGSILITICSVMFAVYLLISKSLITALGSRVFTCIALISASFGIFIYYALTQELSNAVISTRATGIIVTIALFCTVIPTFFTTAAVSRIGADKTGIVAMIGPAFTSIFAVLILLEDYTIYHFIGMLLTIFGVSLLKRKNTNQNKL